MGALLTIHSSGDSVLFAVVPLLAPALAQAEACAYNMQHSCARHVRFFLGSYYGRVTGITATQLASTDCTTLAVKLELHHAWTAAAQLYGDSVNRSARAEGISYQEGLKIWRLQEFGEYTVGIGSVSDAYAKQRSKWEYLRELEEEHLCSGWCTPARPLWTYAEVRDSCSVAAGAALQRKVAPVAQMLMVYSLVVVLASIVGIQYAKNFQTGGEWERL